MRRAPARRGADQLAEAAEQNIAGVMRALTTKRWVHDIDLTPIDMPAKTAAGPAAFNAQNWHGERLARRSGGENLGGFFELLA